VCGIAGILGRPGLDAQRSDRVRRMTAALAHRGPDGEGYARLAGCDLGFRRLAIVDLDAPSPPFANEDGSVWSVCNGEIYNSDEIKAFLEARGHRLRTGVDTEVVPHLYEEYGPDLVPHLDGMFALAIWDVRRRRLVLARDRAGEKPLFYHEAEGEIAFASELRGLLAHPGVSRAVDPVGLRRYLLHDYFPAPLTPIAGVRKLPAAHRLVVEDGRATLSRYWDLADHFGARSGSALDEERLAGELLDLMGEAVRRRRRSDTAVGVFLSGGIDSSAVLALFAAQAGPGIPVFALGHTDPNFDESGAARETAERFEADFDRLVLAENDLQDGLERVGEGFDEPLGDASTIPSHLLARHASRRVKVILSGEGGDELFAGYPTYVGDRVAAGYRRVPPALRRGIVGLGRRLMPVSMGNVGLDYLLGRFAEGAELDRIERHHTWFGSMSPGLQARLLSPPLREALFEDDAFASARRVVEGRRLPDGLSELLYSDFCMYLQDDLLTKVDRATMLASIEARAPFLDHTLAEFAAGLPSSLKLRGFTTKRILRTALRRVLPREVLHRRKRGFNIPFSRWLLHGLGDRLRERFSVERVTSRGLFRPEGVRALIDEHLSRHADHRKPLFTLLALDLWCDRTFGAGARVPLTSGPAASPVAASDIRAMTRTGS
jgi:asparagine synthase (glutamine-hydrolysing)